MSSQAEGGVHYELRYFEGRNGHKVVEAIDIAESDDGSIWVATWGDGIHRIHNTEYKNYTAANGLATNWFRGIEYIGEGKLWAAYKRGLITITGAEFENSLLKPTSGLSDLDFRVVHALSDGRVLAVSSIGETLLYTTESEESSQDEWTVIANKETFQGSFPIGFIELPAGDILASIEKRGIYRLIGTEWMPEWEQDESYLLQKTQDDNLTRIWAAQKNEKDIYELKNDVWTKVASSPESITSFLPLPDNEILLGTDRGIYLLSDGRLSSLDLPPEIGSPLVNAIWKSKSGILWIAANEGLIRGMPRTWQGNFKTDDNVDLINLVHNRDETSPLWFVDAKQRLVRFDGSRLIHTRKPPAPLVSTH